MNLLILLVFVNVSCVLCMQPYIGISRQHFGTEFLENLKKENRGRVGRTSKFQYSSVEDLFSLFEPKLLSALWPRLRSGTHLAVGRACWDDFGVLLRELQQNRAWALAAIDSSGRYSPGLLDGNYFWLGSKTECFGLEQMFLRHDNNGTVTVSSDQQGLEVDFRDTVEEDEMVRRQLQADKVPPFRFSYVTAKVTFNITKPQPVKSYEVKVGVCVPRTCTFDDINNVLDFSVMINDNFKNNKSIPRTVKVSTIKRVEPYYDLKRDAGAIVLIFFTVLLVVLAVLATIVDLELVNFRSVHSKSMSFDLEKPDTENRLTVEALEAKNLERSRCHERPYKHLMQPKTHCCSKKNKQNIDVVDMETLTINNINNSNQINLVTVKKVLKPDAKPPSITLDVVAVDETQKDSCRRCGKYKKQCVLGKETNNLISCNKDHKYNTYEAVTVKSEEKGNKHSFIKNILLCFSLKYSLKRIFNTNMANKDLCAIHILKIVATFWVIFVHVTLVISYISVNNGESNPSYVFSMGTFAFDTLFFVSGALSAHHFFYLKSQYTTEELVSFGGALGQVLQFVCFVTNRAIRLLPSYMYVMFVGAVLARSGRRMSALELPEHDYTTCDMYWWRNLLYINTFYDKQERCMQWSWYLSSESQLHAVGALLLGASRRWRCAVLLAASLLAAGFVADLLLSMHQHGARVFDPYLVYGIIMERPWSRAAPYFVGLLTGWLVHQLDGSMKLGKVTSGCLWTSCAVVVLASLVRPWSGNVLGDTVEVVVASLAHSFWSLALCWPAVVFATQRAEWSRRILGHSSLAALSRLSYGVFLLHGVVVRALLISADTPLVYNSVTLLSYFMCTTVISVVGALLLSLLVETPCCSVLRRLTDCAST